jgi:hypothetical protein
MITHKQKQRAENLVTREAAKMMKAFLKPKTQEKRPVQWADQYKGHAISLLWRCNLEKITPPVDLVMLIGCLFGERHNWSYAKYAAATFLALHHAPIPAEKTLPEGLQSRAARVIEKSGGTLKKLRKMDAYKGNIKRDYRQTLDGWRDEPLFNYVWQQKYNKNQDRQMSPHKLFRDEALEAIKKEFSSLEQDDS